MKRAGIFLFSLLLFCLLCSAVYAGPTPGILKEFRKTEELIRNKKKGKEARKKTLESNLLSAMRLSLRRRFYLKQKELLEGLNADSLAYEVHPSTKLVYFVRYRNFYVRYDFYRDPEIYIQAPKYEKFLIREEGTGDAHDTKPAP